MTLILPDEEATMADQARLATLLRSSVDQAGRALERGAGRDGRPFPAQETPSLHPAVFALVHRIPRLGARHPAEVRLRYATEWKRAMDAVTASAERAAASPCPAWPVDLPGSGRHLRESLDRAVAQLPGRRSVPVTSARMAAWPSGARSILCRAACTLQATWPEMLAELRTTVQQIALMAGSPIGGFTDFHTHGAIFVNRRRLTAPPGAPPAFVVLAETLLHEGAHTRMNAAWACRPWLAAAPGGDDTFVLTPLRPDLRPLSGLLHQLVVLVRCSLFYRQLVGVAGALAVREVARRGQEVVRMAEQALVTAQAHSDGLTAAGRSMIDEAAELLAPVVARVTRWN